MSEEKTEWCWTLGDIERAFRKWGGLLAEAKRGRRDFKLKLIVVCNACNKIIPPGLGKIAVPSLRKFMKVLYPEMFLSEDKSKFREVGRAITCESCFRSFAILEHGLPLAVTFEEELKPSLKENALTSNLYCYEDSSSDCIVCP